MGIELITSKEILEGNLAVLNGTLEGVNELHVSLDLDVLDPAYAPGVGNPEPGGISSSNLFQMIKILGKCRIRAFDIVELSPPYDNGATSAIAAKALALLIAIIHKDHLTI